MQILIVLLIVGAVFMIVDTYAPGLRPVLQFICGTIVGIPIAAYIILKMNRVNDDEVG